MNALTLYVFFFIRSGEPSDKAFLYPDKTACYKQIDSLHNVPQGWKPICLPVQNKAEEVK